MVTVNYTNINPAAQDGEVFATITASEDMMSMWLTDDYGGALTLVMVSPTTYNVVVADSSALPSTVTLSVQGFSMFMDTISANVVDIPVESSFSANPDLADTQINEAVTADVLDNDNGASDATVVSVNVDPAQGTAVINPDGTVTFTPAENFLGEATVTYTIEDANGETSTSTLTVTVSDGAAPTQTVTITSITDDVDPVMGDMPNGTTTNDTTPTLNGTISAALDSNEVVAIYKDGVKVGEATVSGTTWTYADSGLVEGEDYTYTARVEDSAGNLGDTSDEFTITIDTTAPSFTATNGVEIITDADNDGFINASEVGSEVAVKITINQAEMGDAITVSDNFGNTQTIILSDGDLINGYVTTTFPNPPEGATITVIATISDAAGNTSAPATDSAKLDTSDLTDKGGVSVRVVDDADDDGLISATELGGDGKITAEVTLPENAVAGDKLILTGTGNSDVEIVLTQAQIDAGSVQVDFNAPANGVNFVTTAQVIDPALNTSNLAEDSAILKLDAPDAPIVVITEDVNNDGLINANELSGQIDVSVTAPAGTVIGSTLIISDNAGNTQNVTVTQDVIDNGVTVGFPAPAEGDEIVVTAVVEDLAGNQSSEGSDNATIDTTSPTLSSIGGVVITTDTDNDGYIDASEKDASVNVQVNIDKAEVGDIVTVSDNAGHSTSIPLTAANIANGYVTTAFPNPAEGATITVTATISDVAGNVSAPATDSAILDAIAPDAPGVFIAEDVNNDGFINASEVGAQVNVSVTVPAGTAIGSTLIISDNAGNTQNVTVTQDVIDNGTIVSFPNPAEGATIVVKAVVEDLAGNQSSEGSDNAKLDTSDLTDKGGISVRVVDDADDNGLISATELGGDGKITAEVTLPENAVAGDKLILTGTGNSDVEIVLTQAQIDAGSVQVDFNAPANGVNFVTTAQVIDPALNTSNLAEDSAILKLDAPGAPEVVITEDVNNDGLINANELSGQIDVSVTAPAGTAIGSTLIISDNAGNTQNVTVTQDVIDNGVTVGFPAPAEGDEIVVTAVVEDLAGNQSSEGNDSAKLDTSDLAAGLKIEITEDEDNDGFINQYELKDSDIDVVVTLSDNAAAGDTLTVTGSANTPQVITLTQAQIDAGFVNVSFNPPSDGSDFKATAQIKDIAGNLSDTVEDMATMQLSAPGQPAVTIAEDVNNDGYINASELQGNIDIDVALPATAGVGDTLNLDVDGDGVAEQSIVLSLTDVQSGNVSFEVPYPGEGQFAAEVWVTDVAGNDGEKGYDSAIIDTTPPVTNSIDITYITEDTGVSDTDFITYDQTLVIGGTLGNALQSDESVQVSLDGGITWVDATVSGTTWSYDNTGTTLAEGDYDTQVRIVDAVGNVGATDAQTVTVDTTPPATNTIDITYITEDTGTPGDFITYDQTLVIGGTLANALGANELVQVSLDGGTTWVDATVSGTTWSYDNTGSALSLGEYDVEARIIDVAGNLGADDAQKVTVINQNHAPTDLVTSVNNIDEYAKAGNDSCNNVCYRP